MTDFPPFPGFREEAFTFLRELARNNDREWFKPRKSTYEDELLWPMRCLLADVSRRASMEKLPVTGDPKHGIFRIYRDTRFSKNKLPYKTHIGAVLSASGSRKENGVVYIHVEPGASFLAAGYWQPEPSFVRLWRDRMSRDPGSFLDMVHILETRGLPLETEDMLKRMPRGYEDRADEEISHALRLKSYVTSRPVKDELLHEPEFTASVVQMIHDTLPLLQYGWEVERKQ